MKSGYSRNKNLSEIRLLKKIDAKNNEGNINYKEWKNLATSYLEQRGSVNQTIPSLLINDISINEPKDIR